MNNQTTKNERNFILIGIFLFIAVSFSIFQSHGGYTYNPGDSNFSTNPYLDYVRSSSIIDWKQSFGLFESMSIAKQFPYNFLLMALSAIGLSVSTYQIVLFTFLIGSGLWGFNCLLNTYNVNSIFIKIIGSTLYVFNPYTITLVLGGSNFMPLFMVMGLPYLINSKILIDEEKKSGWYFLIGGILITKSALTNPMFGLTFILYILSSIICKFNYKNFINILKISSVFIIFYLDILYSLYQNLGISKDALLKSTIDLNILYFVPGGSTIFRALSLLPHWGFWGSYSNELYYSYSEIFEDIRYVDISSILIILILIFGLREFYRRKLIDIKFLTLLIYFLLSLFFVVGSNPPFGLIYNNLINLLGLSYPLRESHDKATAGLSLASLLLVLVIMNLSKERLLRFLCKLKLLILIFFVLIALNSGNFFRNNGIILGGTKYKLTNEYYEVIDNINNGNILRVLVLPPQWISVPGINSFMIGKDFYTGPDPIDRSIKSQLIYATPFSYNQNSDLSKKLFYELLSSKPEVSIDELKKNGIEAILFRKDLSSITYRYNFDFQHFDNLKINKNLTIIFQNDIFILLKIK